MTAFGVAARRCLVYRDVVRADAWLLTAGLAAIGSSAPAVARACTCGPVVMPAAAEGPYPANGVVLVTSCTDDLPIAQLGVRVGGRAAALVDAGIEVGPYSALLRIVPQPQEGQVVTFDAGLREGEVWPFVYGPTEWTVGPVDDAPPTASATVDVALGDQDADGLSCPPLGPHFVVVLSDLVLSDDVAFVRAEVVRERVVAAVDLLSWDPSAWPAGVPLVLHVQTETEGEACIQAFAMDRAGNATRLGTTACEVDPVEVDGEDEPGLEGRGCGCTTTGRPTGPTGGWGLVVLVFGVRRRA